MLKRLITMVLALGLLGAACTEANNQLAAQRQQAVEGRAQAFARAEKAVPVPRTVNFPLRRALAKMTERQDLLHHPWYVYVLGDTGNMIGYYVAQTVPVNACDFLSSTEDVSWDSNGAGTVLTAPSLDGIFYGGAGSSSGCDAWFFFDYSTDALIQIRGMHFFAVDQPLKVAAQPIEVSAP